MGQRWTNAAYERGGTWVARFSVPITDPDLARQLLANTDACANLGELIFRVITALGDISLRHTDSRGQPKLTAINDL